jgi:pSer/pThr/pTyr-binding forkhead associated (FHA) protein
VSSWLQTLVMSARHGEGTRSAVLELMVLEGSDAGQQFTVDGPEVFIGRGRPPVGRSGVIFLHDRTVSARQATLYTTPDSWTLEHCHEATNPTRVNTKRISQQVIEPGDRIEMGRVVMEARVRQGITLTDLLPPLATGTEALDESRVRERAAARADAGVTASAATEVRAPLLPRGHLRLLRGLPEFEGKRFPLQSDTTVLGRSCRSDVHIPEPGISRCHAELVWEQSGLILLHRSATNSTSINGVPVSSRQLVKSGDEILLADQVVLRLELQAEGIEEATAEGPSRPVRRSHRPSLREQMEEELERDRMIEEEFTAAGSFLDVDVVGSYVMKQGISRPAHIIVAFERFRAFVEHTITEFQGQVLNSNGDEVMCFFDSPLQAVTAGSQLLCRLEVFNLEQNVLPSPFRFRIGVHTGTSLVDLERGVAYSPVLDVAGHLQKQAGVNGLLISQDTLDALPEGLPFEPAGELEREGIPIYRLCGDLTP